MVGRFVGAWLMQLHPCRNGAGGRCASAPSSLMLVTVLTTGPLAMWALILVGLFHSIMFPTIFTLAIKGLGR